MKLQMAWGLELNFVNRDQPRSVEGFGVECWRGSDLEGLGFRAFSFWEFENCRVRVWSLVFFETQG